MKFINDHILGLVACILMTGCVTTQLEDCKQWFPEFAPKPSVAEQTKILESQGIVRLEKAYPKYPLSELRAGRSGAVLLTALIGKDGKVDSLNDITVDKIHGNEAFGLESKKALMLWRWDVSKAAPNALPAKFQMNTSFCVTK